MSSDTALEARLRATYDAVTSSTTYSAPPPMHAVDGPTTRARRPRRGLVVAAAFAAVLAIVAAVTALHVSVADDHRPKPAPASKPSLFPDVEHHTGPELFLSPRAVTPGYQLQFATGPTQVQGGGGSTGSPTIWQHWVRLDAAGTRPLTGFSLGWGPADLSTLPTLPAFTGIPPQQGDALDDYRGGTALTVNGHEAYWSPTARTLAWDQDGQIVVVKAWTVTGGGVWPVVLSQAEVEAIGQAVAGDRRGGYRFTEQPAGFRLAAQVPSLASSGRHPRRLVYSDGADHGFSIQLIDDTDVPPGVMLTNPGSRLVEVGTRTAVLDHERNGRDESGCGALDAFLCSINLGDRDFTYLQWLAPDSTRVTVTAVGLTDDQVLQVARGLRPVDRAGWKALMEAGATPGCVLISHCVGFDHPPRGT